MDLSRQEYQSGLPFPSLGDLSNPEIKPWYPALQADSLLSESLGEALYWGYIFKKWCYSILICLMNPKGN